MSNEVFTVVGIDLCKRAFHARPLVYVCMRVCCACLCVCLWVRVHVRVRWWWSHPFMVARQIFSSKLKWIRNSPSRTTPQPWIYDICIFSWYMIRFQHSPFRRVPISYFFTFLLGVFIFRHHVTHFVQVTRGQTKKKESKHRSPASSLPAFERLRTCGKEKVASNMHGLVSIKMRRGWERGF